MADSPLVKRLGIKPGHRALLLHAPDGFQDRLVDLPPDAVVSADPDGAFDVVLAFVGSRADADARAPVALGALRQGGALWFAYPKKAPRLTTDISRDVGWDALWAAGWEGIAIIRVDETWSALRFRPSADVKRRG